MSDIQQHAQSSQSVLGLKDRKLDRIRKVSWSGRLGLNAKRYIQSFLTYFNIALRGNKD